MALSFTACDSYEETDDVANQRAEQEALVKAENLKDAYNEYASAYSDWYNKSDSITSIEKKINKYKQSLILLDNGYDEATFEAMQASNKAEYEDELTIAQARLKVYENAEVDVKVIRTKIDSLDKAILALGDNEFSDVFEETKAILDAWYVTYSDGNELALVYGKGYDISTWEVKANIIKESLSIAIEPKKEELDSLTKLANISKVAYDAALEVYTLAKTARDIAKARKDAETAVTDAVAAEQTAQEAYDADPSDANKDALDSAKEDVEVANSALTEAVADAKANLIDSAELNDATTDFNTANSIYEDAKTSFETASSEYTSAERDRRYSNSVYNGAVNRYKKFDIDVLKAELIELNANYAAALKITGKIRTIVAQKTELENTMFFIEANYGKLSTSEDYIEVKITEIEDEINNLRINIAEIEAGVDGNDLTAEEIQEAITSNEVKLVATNELLAAAKAQLDAAKAAYEALIAKYTEKTEEEKEVVSGE